MLAYTATMSRDHHKMVKILIGDIFESKADALVNTVNTVGVMGKGLALGFKNRFPDMFADYARRCKRGGVRLGQPYLYRRSAPPHIVNFPTKGHWRSRSNLSDIVRGLEYLEAHIHEWGITSLAVPSLGCGEGKLEWSIVGPTLYRHLDRLGTLVELYAPFKIEPGWIALVVILEQVSQERYHWIVNRTGFQKIAYFATEVGIPTGLVYKRGSYGPCAAGIEQLLSRLENNGLIRERQSFESKTSETLVGPAYLDVKHAYASMLDVWKDKIDRVVDLIVRMAPNDAAIAAAAHFVATEYARQHGRRATEHEVYEAVLQWKKSRRPPLDPVRVAMAVRGLNILRWLNVSASSDLPVPEEAAIA